MWMCACSVCVCVYVCVHTRIHTHMRVGEREYVWECVCVRACVCEMHYLQIVLMSKFIFLFYVLK